ncbi:MAG: hypothetical protein JOZ72_17505 [Alphaproteobacteria bacterium]|nr:hypothetical protein [Alphaproteobacteria bacterium]
MHRHHVFSLSLLSLPALASCAAPARVTPQMRTVVTCVYDSVRAHPGVLSTEVYAVGDGTSMPEYVVEFKYRSKNGTIRTGDMGLYDDPGRDGRYPYVNESPRGQGDHGSEELDFLGDEWNVDMMEHCLHMPTIDDTFVIPGVPYREPPRGKVEMDAS